MKEYTLKPCEEQLHSAIDKNDPAAQHTAIEYEFPFEFSPRAKMALDYFEVGTKHSTALLFGYKGRFVVTDESCWLTAHGDGTPGNAMGFPRFECGSMEELEEWLEIIADDLEDEGEWEQE